MIFLVFFLPWNILYLKCCRDWTLLHRYCFHHIHTESGLQGFLGKKVDKTISVINKCRQIIFKMKIFYLVFDIIFLFWITCMRSAHTNSVDYLMSIHEFHFINLLIYLGIVSQPGTLSYLELGWILRNLYYFRYMHNHETFETLCM